MASENEQVDGNNGAGAGQQSEHERTFTQAELDRIIADRLSRQKAQYPDYEELKAKAAKLTQLEEQQKSEAQKLADRLAKLERERDEAVAQSQDRLIRAAFLAEAAKAGVAHPGDVFALADRQQVAVNAAGEVAGVAEAVKAVIDAGRVPLANRALPPKLDGGAGGGARQGEKDIALTAEELEVARKLGLSPEKYAESKKKAKARS